MEPYVTKDSSTIRELFHPGSSPVEGFSVAEAEVAAGLETDAHVHKKSQEIYYILEGAGTMRLGGEIVQSEDGRRHPDTSRHAAQHQSGRGDGYKDIVHLLSGLLT